MGKSIKQIFDADSVEDIGIEVTNWAERTISYMEKWEYKSAVQSYEDIQLYMGRRLLENTKKGFGWSSNEKYPLIANAWRTYSGMMSRLNLNKVVVSSYMPTVDDATKKGIPVYKNLVKYFLNKPETKSALTQIIDEALAIGTSYGRVSWKKKKKKVVKSVTEGKKNGQKKITYDTIEWGYPTIKYCSYFNVLRDLSDNDRYIGERYFADKMQISKDYDISSADWEKIDKSNMIFNYDYNKVKNIAARDSEIKEKCGEIINRSYSGSKGSEAANKLPKHDNWYAIDNNELYEVFDVDIDGYEDTYNVVLINGYVIYAGLSNQPFAGPKIIQLDFEKMPGETFGKGIGWMGRGYQSSVDTLYNSYLNSIKILTNPMFTMEETLTGKQNATFNYGPWAIMPKSGGAYTLERIELVKASDTANNLQAIQTIEAKFNADLGMNSYVTGASGGIERSAAGVRQKKLGTDNKVSKFLENINIFVSDAIEKMSLLQMVFGKDVMSEIEGEEVSFKNKEIITGYKVTFDGEDILGEKSAKTAEAINILSSIAPFNIDQDTGEQIIDPRQLLTNVFDSVDMYDIVKSDEDKLTAMKTKVDYMTKKREILSAIEVPTDPFDKQNMSITFSGKDLMDIPEARETILASIGIKVDEPDANGNLQETEAEQQPSQEQISSGTPNKEEIQINQPAGRPLNIL